MRHALGGEDKMGSVRDIVGPCPAWLSLLPGTFGAGVRMSPVSVFVAFRAAVHAVEVIGGHAVATVKEAADFRGWEAQGSVTALLGCGMGAWALLETGQVLLH